MNEKKTRKKRVVNEENKNLNSARKLLPINTLEVEIEADTKHRTYRKSKKNNRYFEQDAVRYIADVSEEMRQLQNTIQNSVYKRYLNIYNTKKYRGMLKSYGKLNEQILKLEKKKKKSKEDKEYLMLLKNDKKDLSLKLEDMKIDYKIGKSFVVDEASRLKDTTFKKVNSIMALKCADRVWLAMEKLMYNNAKKLKFQAKGTIPSLEAKQANRGIILKLDKKADKFFVTFDKYKFNLKIKKNDLYVQETLSHIKNYISDGDSIDKENIELFLSKKPIKSTYRILYNRIVLKEIRGKLRLYLQVVYEGKAVPRRNKDGSFRHIYGEGAIGGDIGTQSVAIVSKDKAILKNLAERSKKTLKFENKIKILERAMDRSKRSNNKDFFNKDGTFKNNSDRPKDISWSASKKYTKIKYKRKELHRKVALSRKYAINEDVNAIRTLGDKVIVEKMNIQGLQKRVKEITINEKTGRFNKRKRYGKSIGNRCPGGFMAQLKRRFEGSNGEYIEVNTWSFKASQYDHILKDCNKKQLSKRWHQFESGLRVQRDLYSAMLLYCSNETYEEPDNKKCISFFDTFLNLHNICVENIKLKKYRVLNSGIKI